MTRMLRIDARHSRELRDIIVALYAADRGIQKWVRQTTKTILVPEWREALAAQGTSPLESRVIVSTAGVTPSNQNIRLTSATKGRPLSGGLAPKTDYPAVEFGTKKRGQFKTYQGRRGNKRFTVKRRTAQQLPVYRKAGYVFYPAVKGFVPRAAALWAQTTVRVLADAFDGKAS